jgi:hypothetical protein
MSVETYIPLFVESFVVVRFMAYIVYIARVPLNFALIASIIVFFNSAAVNASEWKSLSIRRFLDTTISLNQAPDTCRKAFESGMKYQTTITTKRFDPELRWEQQPDGSASVRVLHKRILRRLDESDPESEVIVHGILDRWSRHRGYNQDQVDYLLKMDRSLDRRRTSYFQLEADGKLAAFRLFDGSEQPFSEVIGPLVFRNSDRRLQLEIEDSEIVLPENRYEGITGQGRHVFSLGLLSVDRGFIAGLKLLFGAAAAELDEKFGFQYTLYGSVARLKKRRVVIYAHVRKSHLKIYGELGLLPVWHIDSKGDVHPLVMKNGMYVIRIDGADFVQRFSPYEWLQRLQADRLMRRYHHLRDHQIRSLLELRAARLDLSSGTNIIKYSRALDTISRSIESLPLGSEERRLRIKGYVRQMYIFFNSLPESARLPNYLSEMALWESLLLIEHQTEAQWNLIQNTETSRGTGYLNVEFSY